MHQQRARDLCPIVLPTPPPLSSATSPNCFYTKHYYVEQAYETHSRALNKTAVETAFLTAHAVSLWGLLGAIPVWPVWTTVRIFPKQLVCVYLTDTVNCLSDKFPLFRWQLRCCGLVRKQQTWKNSVSAWLPVPACSFPPIWCCLTFNLNYLVMFYVPIVSHLKSIPRNKIWFTLKSREINKMGQSSIPCVSMYFLQNIDYILL